VKTGWSDLNRQDWQNPLRKAVAQKVLLTNDDDDVDDDGYRYVVIRKLIHFIFSV
jgi:hypothetical protein